jgi:hypothetical protein
VTVPGRDYFHTAYVARDLAAAQQELSASLGLTFTPVIELTMDVSDWRGKFTFPNCMVMSLESSPRIELIPTRRGTVFESDLPLAFHHIAYWVDDLSGEVDRLTRDGLELELWGNGEGARLAEFAFLRQQNGMRLELVDCALRPGFEKILQPSTTPQP